MASLPVMLDVRGWRCVVVGGGAVALRRARALLDAGALVTVVAPQVNEALDARAVRCARPFEPADAQDARLLVIATDDPTANSLAAAAAGAAGALVNRADEAESGELTFMAHRPVGPATVAVDSGGASAAAARAMVEQVAAALDPSWPVLLETAARYRALVQQRFTPGEARQARLRKLADSAAMQMLKDHGPAALDAYCQQIADPHADLP